MLDTTKIRILAEIERLSLQVVDRMPNVCLGAMRSFFAALEHGGESTLRTSLVSAQEEFANAVDAAVKQQLGWPVHAKQVCQRIRESLRNCAAENWDDVGAEIESRFDERLGALTKLRDGPVKLLRDHGLNMASADLLDADIGEATKLKHSMIDDWPWSTNELPPIDREMLAKSMAALARGEKGEPIEDLIRRLGGIPAMEARESA